MATDINSFHITDMIYDSQNRHLTYKFILDGVDVERVSIGCVTDEDIISDFQKTLNKHFAK